MTCYQCEDCRRWYTGETGWIRCPRCGSKERDLFPLAEAIYDAVMVTRHQTTGKITNAHANAPSIVVGMCKRIEARLKELGM